MPRSYDFQGRNRLSKNAIRDIIAYLATLDETKEAVDVSDDPEFMEKDIDIVWKKKDESETTIEVKADDKMHRTGNFFLETISNDVKDTPGCFMYSEADEFFYFDVRKRILYAFDLEAARKWFIPKMKDFVELPTSTEDSNGNVLYRTLGRLVKISILKQNVEVKEIQL